MWPRNFLSKQNTPVIVFKRFNYWADTLLILMSIADKNIGHAIRIYFFMVEAPSPCCAEYTLIFLSHHSIPFNCRIKSLRAIPYMCTYSKLNISTADRSRGARIARFTAFCTVKTRLVSAV